MRELDLLLESYLERHATTMTRLELQVFERFLDATDMDLYDWVTGRASPSTQEFGAIVAELISGDATEQ
jgi:antitoxin CptB